MNKYWANLLELIRLNTNNYIIFENEVGYSKNDIFQDLEVVQNALLALEPEEHSIVGIISDNNYCQLLGILASGMSSLIPAPLGQFPLSEQKKIYSQKVNYKIYLKQSPKLSVKVELLPGNMKIKSGLENVSMVYPTSGTSTGKSKAVLQSFEQLSHTQYAINERMGLQLSSKELIASPFDNVYWFGRVRCILALKGSLVFVNNPINPLSIIKTLSDSSVLGFSCDTPLLKMLLDYDIKSGSRIFGHLEYVKTASAPLEKSYFTDFLKKYPNVKIYYNYGLTEAMRTSILTLPKELDRLGSSGRPLTGVNVKIKSGNTMISSPNVRGEILVTGKNVALGYDDFKAWNDVNEGGFFKTGDCGYLDEKNFLYVLGRWSDAFHVQGNVYFPSEIEEYLVNSMGVNTNFIIAEQRNKNDESSYVIVTENKDFNSYYLEDINNYLAKSTFKNLSVSDFVYYEKIPTTNNGKYQRSKVKEILNDLPK